MKRSALAAVAGLTTTVAASAVAFSAAGAGAASLPPCIPKIGKVQGHTAVSNCGPATATLKVGGKTYNFKGGYCSSDPAAHLTLQLSLGTLVSGSAKGNAGLPSFQLELINSGALKLDTLNADYGGRELVNLISLSVSGSATSGTFTAKASAFGGQAASGSWNCHGSIYKV